MRSSVEIYDIRSRTRRVVWQTERLVEAPNWSPDVKAYITYNLMLTYTGIKNLSITAGIKNLLNTDPPFSAAYDSNTGAGSSWEPRIADPRGRSYVLGAIYTFK